MDVMKLKTMYALPQMEIIWLTMDKEYQVCSILVLLCYMEQKYFLFYRLIKKNCTSARKNLTIKIVIVKMKL